MAKQLMFSDDARKKILDGVEKLSRAVRSTLGPTGHVVMFEKSFGGPNCTKDGVTVAKEISLEDPFENMGAQMIKEVASKTSDIAGDGTTTATVLAEAIYRRGLKVISSGADPMAVKRGIDMAVEAARQKIAEMSIPCRKRADIAAVAAISANNDKEIGDIIADAMDKVGTDGVIQVEEARGIETTMDLVEGMQFDKGYLSPYFINNTAAMTCQYEDCYILIHEKKISNIRELIPILEKIATSGKPLCIIAEDIDGEALAALVINKLRGTLNCVAVKAPGFGERRKAMLEDIAIMTGGVAVTEDLGIKLESIELENLGVAKSITIDKDNTTIVEGKGKKADINARVEQIKNRIGATSSDYDREKLQERLAKLSGGVAVINVGAATESEMKEKKDRIEDALHASRAAAEEGVVVGGGVALLRCVEAVEAVSKKAKGDEKLGVGIIAEAVTSPLFYIADNSGEDGSVVVAEVAELPQNEGFNAFTGKYEDLVKAGVIDPAKVTRSALQNAGSIAGLLLTVETMVTDLSSDKDAKAIAGSIV